MFRKYLFVLLIAVILTPGCQSNMAVKRIQAKNPVAKNAPKTPAKFVDVWNNFAQSTPEGKVMRGIAGRVHFYADNGKKQTVKVDGDVTVFVFDADETDPARSKPLRVYQFKADSLPKHYAHKKPLGHGYDFFLPFDEIGGEEKRLCVMTRFDDRLEGSFVLSPPVNTILQGTKPEPAEPSESVREFLASKSIMSEANRQAVEQAMEGNPIRQVGYENKVAPTNDVSNAAPESRAVASIMLSETMARRIGPGQEPSQPPPPTPMPTTPERTEESTKTPRSKVSSYQTKAAEFPKVEFPAPPF